MDAETLRYLRVSGRSEDQVQLVEEYMKAQGMFHTPGTPEPLFSETLELDLSTVVPSIAGPKRPQDRVLLTEAKANWETSLNLLNNPGGLLNPPRQVNRWEGEGGNPTAVGVEDPRSPTGVRMTHRRGRALSRPRLHRDRRDYQLHEYVEPVRDDGRRTAGQEGRELRADDQALGED